MPGHPRDLDATELAELAGCLTGLLYHLRDFIAEANTLAGAEREAAFQEACQHAYDIVYLEHIPKDALEIRGATDYDLPSFSGREKEELEELVWSISWLALDLAQHLSFATKYIKQEFQPEAYLQAVTLSSELADFPVADVRDTGVTPGLAAFGAKGLESWTR